MREKRENIRKKRRRQLILKRHVKRPATISGKITVSGEGQIVLPIRGHKPKMVRVGFTDDPGPRMGCGPTTEDQLDACVRKLGPFPIWSVCISWNIQSGDFRELEWSVMVLR